MQAEEAKTSNRTVGGQEARLMSDIDDMLDEMPDCDDLPAGVLQYYD
jgi:hypothetical protein